MNQLSQEMQKVYDAQIVATKQCSDYYFAGGQLAQFDSVVTSPEKMPDALKAIYDNLGSEWIEKIDKAVHLGIEAYKARNGGDLPSASVMASAIQAGANIAKRVEDGNFAKGLFDSVKQATEQAGFDDVTNGQYEQSSIVPALTVVTIANVIANSLPLVSLLPNPQGSVRIPVVAVRYTTDSTFGAMKAGEYLDGATAAQQYVEGRFSYALSNNGSGTEYSVVARTVYKDVVARTPDENARLLPFLAGNVSIRINGLEVAHTRGEHNLSVVKGKIAALIKRSVTIAETEYTVTKAEVNIDESKITVTLDKELPEGAVMTVSLVTNYDAKDETTKNYKLQPVGVSLEPYYEVLQSVPIHARIEISANTQNQLANELGLGFVGAALATIQGKIYLEQNVRLLKEAKERAIFAGRTYTFDVSRSVAGNLTQAVNTTGDLIGEIMKFVELAKQKIQQASGGVTTKFDMYVGNKGAVFFKQLSADNFRQTGATASFGEIVRIGTLKDGTDVYQTPNEQGVITEGDTTAQVFLLGRGNEPARNPFVGTITMPMTIREAKPDGRTVVFYTQGQMAAEINPLDRYADQSAVINMINLQALDAK